jgi:fibronectin-binding autotransporter adhesin
VLESTTNFGIGVGSAAAAAIGSRTISNNGTLGFRINNGATWNFNRLLSGLGGLVRDGGTGTLNLNLSGAVNSTYAAGSTTVTVASTTGLTPGMIVSGAGIPTGAAIQQILSGTTYQISVAPTAAGTNVGLVYGLGSTAGSTFAASNTTVTVADTSSLKAGLSVSGAGIPIGAVIQQILSGTTYQLSAPTTAAGTSASLIYGAAGIGGGVAVVDGGVTNFNAPTVVSGGGFFIRGLEALTTVNWASPVHVQSGGLTLRGTGENVTTGAILNVNSASTVSGAINILAADLRLANGGSLAGVTTITVGGSGSTAGGNAATQQGLYITNTVAANNGNRINDAAAIVLKAGRITLVGNGTSGTGAFAETVGQLSIASGANLVYSLDNNAASNVLTFASFGTRSAGSMIVFDTVTGTTDTGTIAFTSLPTLTNNIIGGWALKNTVNSGVVKREWATMSGNNIVALADVNYTITSGTTSSDSWVSSQNVKITGFNQSLTASRTIHSLNIQDATARTITINPVTSSAERSLTINSGGILTARNTHTIAGGKLIAGTHAGSQNPYELVIYTPSNQLNITSVIADTTTRLGGNSAAVTGLTATTISGTTVTVSSTAGLEIGAAVSGAGIADGTTITGITNGTTFQISQAASGSSVALTFSDLTNVVTGLSSTAGLTAGMRLVSATGFQGPATIVSVDSLNQITLDQAVTVGSSINFDFIQQSTSLVKAGANTLVLNPTLSIGSNGLMNPNSFDVTLASGSFNTGVVVGATVTGAGIAAGTTVVALIGNNGVRLSQQPTAAVTSTLTFALPNYYTGKTYINEGVLQIARESDLGLNPGTFAADHLTINGGILRASTDLVFNDSNRGITLGVADGLFRVADNRTLTIGAVNTITGAEGRMIFAADGSSRGVLVVAGNNDLSGGLETSGDQAATTGTLSSTFNFGSTSVTVATTAGLEVGTSVSGNGIADGTTIASIIDGRTFTLSTAAIADGSGQGLQYNRFNAVKLTGNNTIGFIRQLGSSIALLGNNTLTGDILVANGMLRLGGNNQFNGTLTVSSGQVVFESNTGLQSTTGYSIRNSGTVNLNGYSTTAASITGNGTITNDGPTGSTSVLTINTATSFTYDGFLSNGVNTGGTLALTKTGDGILTLSGTGNSYGGATVINGGGIRVAQLGFGGSASSIGASSNAAANLVFNGGSLRFFDNTSTFTDRSFTLGTGDNAGAIIADGTVIGARLTFGFANFSPAVEFTGLGSRTLTLGGANRGDNMFNLVLGDGEGGPTSLNKIGNGTWVLGATSSYKGETVVNAGILAATVNGAFGATGGAGIIIAGGTNAQTTLGNQNATVDLRNVAYTTVQTMYLAGGTLATTVGSSSWAGPVFATANSNITVQQGASLELKGTLGGAGAITQLGEGLLILSGQADPTTRNSMTSATVPSHTVLAGTLRLDYSTNNNSKLSDTGALILGGSRFGGSLELASSVGANSHVEIVSGVTLNAGANRIFRSSGLNKLRMNGIGRAAGATVDFSANDIASTDTNNINGILGGWATVGGSTWAVKSQFNESGVDTGNSTGADLLIRGLTTYTNTGAFPGPLANDWMVNANMDVVGNSTQNTRTANTLRFNNTPNVAGNSLYNISLTGINVIQSSGILFTNNMGAHAGVLGGTGTLTGGAGSNADLLIIQNNTGSGALDISAIIANLAPTGRDGTVTSGTNTITGISLVGLAPGLVVTGTGVNATINTITVTDAVNQIGTLTMSANASSGTGVPIALAFTPVVNGLDKTGVGNLILSGLNTYTGTNTLNAGITTVRTLAVEGYAAGTALISFAPSLGRTLTVDTNGLTIGQGVSGAELPAGVTIAVINSPTTLTLSNGALVTTTANLLFDDNVVAKNGSISATTTNGSATITVPGGTAGLTVGQTVSGTGIPGVTVTILSIVNGTQITIGESGTPINATVSGTNNLTFGSNSIVEETRSATTQSGSRIVVGSTLGMVVGQTISGTGIPGSSTILRILDENTIEISNPVSSTGQNNLTYGARATAIGATLPSGTVSGSNVITFSSPLSGAQLALLSVGQAVSGPGIPEGAVVTAILSSTQIEISVSAIYSGTNNLVFAGTASGLGASGNAVSNLIFNGGILQFNGTNASTDRGFTINQPAILDVGNAYTVLTLGGNYATPASEELYSIIKRGEGTLDMRGTAFGG